MSMNITFLNLILSLANAYAAMAPMKSDRRVVEPHTTKLFAIILAKCFSVNKYMYDSNVTGLGIHFGGIARTVSRVFNDELSTQAIGNNVNAARTKAEMYKTSLK